MSGGGERGYKVLLLLGITAAAAVITHCAINWLSRPSPNSKSKSKLKCNKKDTKSTTIEAKGKTVDYKENTVISEEPTIKDTEFKKDMATEYPMAAPKSQAVKALDGRKDISKSCCKPADENVSIKENGTLWSELVEEEQQKPLKHTVLPMTANANAENSMSSHQEDARGCNDSGVVSPQNTTPLNHCLASPIKPSYCEKEGIENSYPEVGLTEDSKGGRRDGETTENQASGRNDQEPQEVDGGLGSSVCGDDCVQVPTSDGAITDQHKKADENKVSCHTNGNDELTANLVSQQSQVKTEQNEDGSVRHKSQRQATGGSDSGQGSEADDGIRMAYHFYIPNYLCGKLIGRAGEAVKQLKNETQCSIQLHERSDILQEGRYNNNRKYKKRNRDNAELDPFEMQVCVIQGTRNGIDRCLDLIREKFPLQQHENLTMEQTNMPNTTPSSSTCSLILGAETNSNGSAGAQFLNQTQEPTNINKPNIPTPTQLGLDQGAMHEVYVSAIVSGGHVFLQQPNHPTHHALPRLESCIQNVYTRLAVPDIPRELLEAGLVCVANWNQQWYRVQVVKYDPTSDSCYVRFLDYGGYYTFTPSDLKQIRSDFLSLPFQALEVYLGNVIPPDQEDWPVQSAVVLEELVANQIISGRMLGVTEDYVPIVHLYGWVNVDNSNDPLSSSDNSQRNQHQPRLLNRELVDRGVALWTEHILASSA